MIIWKFAFYCLLNICIYIVSFLLFYLTWVYLNLYYLCVSLLLCLTWVYLDICLPVQICEGSLCNRIGYNDSISDTFTPSWDECYITGGSDLESRKRMCYLACQKSKRNAMCPMYGAIFTSYTKTMLALRTEKYILSYSFIQCSQPKIKKTKKKRKTPSK